MTLDTTVCRQLHCLLLGFSLSLSLLSSLSIYSRSYWVYITSTALRFRGRVPSVWVSVVQTMGGGGGFGWLVSCDRNTVVTFVSAVPEWFLLRQ
ncbi:hypothetical protein BT67DRAFT_155737 [Trichocladium antarcticum]|uniref:Uncharacterized protein n=1 Tax=Trichocladium antarcticum TaxID=1450529 RepID=A0AAN6UF26_9PEZI|nr:hypothetical protein BT67DRAFT_155737 [Trichocladium antarcticum]